MLNIKELMDFYELLSDDESKEIFGDRVLYTLTGDNGYLRRLALHIPEVRSFNKLMSSIDDPIIMYSAGIRGRRVVRAWDNYPWTAYTDRNSELAGKIINGIPVLLLEEIIDRYPSAYYVIPNRVGWEKIEAVLVEKGIKKNRVINIARDWKEVSNRQYFDLSDIAISQKEVFVDGGFYDGDTSVSFINWCNSCYGHIYGFEPDKKNLGDLHSSFRDADLNRISIINKGLWDKTGQLSFKDGADQGSMITEEGNSCIEVTTIDKELYNVPVSFIKMDIEGAELNALIGAEKTIQRYFPKLAICIYHKKEDLTEIPRFLMQYKNHYSFYVRHYNYAEGETVLYALPRK